MATTRRPSVPSSTTISWLSSTPLRSPAKTMYTDIGYKNIDDYATYAFENGKTVRTSTAQVVLTKNNDRAVLTSGKGRSDPGSLTTTPMRPSPSLLSTPIWPRPPLTTTPEGIPYGLKSMAITRIARFSSRTPLTSLTSRMATICSSTLRTVRSWPFPSPRS